VLLITNILIINTNCSWNKGSAAQVISTTETLSKLFPTANFTLISGSPELDVKLCKRHNIKVVGFGRKNSFTSSSRSLMLFRLFHLWFYLARCAFWSFLCKLGLNATNILNERVLREYQRADLILDLSGDTLSDKNMQSILPLSCILIGLLLKKKIAIFSQSIGPFKKIIRPLARLCLNKADLIVLRENVTKNYLKEMGVTNSSTYLAADVAFLLEPVPSKKVQEIFFKEGITINRKNNPLIGISTSELIYKALKNMNDVYLSLIARLVDYLVETLNAQVIFISHVIVPPKYGYTDDRFVAEEIYKLVRNKKRLTLIKGDYSPEELKGIIGNFDLFLGTRMHSNIASTSMHVPTIALGWSHKSFGIMKMLGQEKYVCNIEKATYKELISKINDAWYNKDVIVKTLISRNKELRNSALNSIRLIEKLIS
jgi:colanic acid/amylovoran biosynthesis protein